MALTDLDSTTKRLIAQESGGIMSRQLSMRIGASTTAATTNSGLIDAQRAPKTFTIPSVTGYTGWELDADMICDDTSILMAALEFDLGVLTVSSNTFAAGSDASTPSMDTRFNGTSYTGRQTASLLPFLVATAALTATTPVITTTYVNQAGTGSRTCTMTLPTNAAANSAFLMTPHLNSGDTGMQDVTNMSKSAGTAGTLAVKGLLPVAIRSNTLAGGGLCGFMALHKPVAPVVATSGQTLAFYTIDGGTTVKEIIASVFGRPI